MKGVVIFCHNNGSFDYLAMAKFCAKRVNKFLSLPVTLITDKETFKKSKTYLFDKVLFVEPNKNNFKENTIWINKDRFKVFELTPYDETILLDSDYIVNSTKLLKTFDICKDICVHNSASYIMQPKLEQELVSPYMDVTAWATVITFQKTKKAKQVFEVMEMIQKNYNHYANLHNFIAGTFRNDYALTLALRIVDGHLPNIANYIPWNLLHVGRNTVVYNLNDDINNNEFLFMFDNWRNNKIKKEYITLKNLDFHLMNKNNLSELINE